MRNYQNWQRNEATSLQERSQQHQQRFLVGGGGGGGGGGGSSDAPPVGAPSGPAPRKTGDDGLGELDKDWGEWAGGGACREFFLFFGGGGGGGVKLLNADFARLFS